MATKKQHLFKTVAGGNGSNEMAEVKDGLGSVIEVRKQQSFSYNQQAAWGRVAQEAEKLSYFEQQIAVVAEMLRLEFKVKGMSDEDILTDTDGNAVSADMITRLYDHYSNIKNRHAPDTQLMFLSGPDAEKAAIAYADQEEAVVVTNDQMELMGQYYVFRSTDSVTDLNLGLMMSAGKDAANYRVIHSAEAVVDGEEATPEPEPEPEAEGNAPELTGTDIF